jgi:hypothetical protein
LITEDDLRAAAETIDQTSDAAVQRKLNQLKEARKARTSLEVLRQQAELDSLELDQAAYQLASQSADDGDLPSAAHWYRVAAINDFGDSPLKLAKVLDSLAATYLTKPESRMATREEMDLVSEAARWYAAAYAAGDIEAAELLDNLVARHDPTRPRARPNLVAVKAETDPSKSACALGGLRNVMALQIAESTAHCGSCRSCQNELIELSGGKHPATPTLAPAPADDPSTPPRHLAECGSGLHPQPSRRR